MKSVLPSFSRNGKTLLWVVALTSSCLFSSSCVDLLYNSAQETETLRRDCQECKRDYRNGCIARGTTTGGEAPGLLAWKQTSRVFFVSGVRQVERTPYTSGEVLVVCELESVLFCELKSPCTEVPRGGGSDDSSDSGSSSNSRNNN